VQSVIARQRNSGSEKFLQCREKFSEGKGKSPRQERKLQSMKNGDTIATVIAFCLVLPWLARLIASAKATWRALDEGQTTNETKQYEKNETQ
jgi:hypothetical protein